MKEKTLYYYRQGHNCSQCLLKAAESIYKVPISKKSLAMCSGINTGFGIGGMCSVLIAGIMLFGLLFDEATAKSLRMKLFNEYMSYHNSLDCCELKKHRKNGYLCEEIIGEIAALVEKIINEEL